MRKGTADQTQRLDQVEGHISISAGQLCYLFHKLRSLGAEEIDNYVNYA